MALSMNYNRHFPKDRSSNAIIVSAEGQSLAQSVIVDLYVRLLSTQGELHTANAVYTAAIYGDIDINDINIISNHYFWMSGCFKHKPDRSGERYLLN